MLTQLTTLIGFLALSGASLAAVPRFQSTIPPGVPKECSGCEGAGGSATAFGGSCGGALVTVSIDVLDGWCDDLLIWDYCDDLPCNATVMRTWQGLPASTPLEFCRTVHGVTWCLSPPPSTGSGSGSSTISDTPVACGLMETFTISHACGISATATAECSLCES